MTANQTQAARRVALAHGYTHHLIASSGGRVIYTGTYAGCLDYRDVCGASSWHMVSIDAWPASRGATPSQLPPNPNPDGRST